jgi:hypothetical protein
MQKSLEILNLINKVYIKIKFFCYFLFIKIITKKNYYLIGNYLRLSFVIKCYLHFFSKKKLKKLFKSFSKKTFKNRILNFLIKFRFL